MSGDAIGFSEISDVHRNERRSKTLTKLPKGFFDSATQHLRGLKEEYDRESHSPSSPKLMMLQDNIKKLDKRIREIYEMRERKIVIASLGNPQPPENMNARERALFGELTETLEHYRTGGETRQVKKRAETEKVPEAESEPAECQTELREPEPPTKVLTDIAVVQVLEDVPPFVGVNNTYVLRKDDVVSLPNQYADLLSSKGKVRIIDA